jgi:hypothetical protein
LLEETTTGGVGVDIKDEKSGNTEKRGELSTNENSFDVAFATSMDPTIKRKILTVHTLRNWGRWLDGWRRGGWSVWSSCRATAVYGGYKRKMFRGRLWTTSLGSFVLCF